MIQSISNSSTNLDSIQTISSQINKNTPKRTEPVGLGKLSKSTQEIVIRETVNLIKGVTIDLLRAALASLTDSATPTNCTYDKGDPVKDSPVRDSTDSAKPKDKSGSVNSNNKPTNTTSDESSAPRKNEALSSFLLRELKPNSKGDFHEEQLQYGVAGYLLNEKSPALYKQYQSEYSNYESQTGSTSNYEDVVKVALKSLVDSNKLTKKEAEEINGKSFRAAQLDKDLKTLFDDKGGPGDNTVAVLSAKEATDKVDRLYGRIRRGELEAQSRSLDAPSNSKPSSSTPTNSTSGLSGFLWKPVSESDGKLVILAPSNISQSVESVSIYKIDSKGKKTLIEEGKSSGIANGDRAHFRFKKAGSGYADGSVVEIELKGGEVISETIKETSSRVSK